jgi:hypothetical protein
MYLPRSLCMNARTKSRSHQALSRFTIIVASSFPPSTADALSPRLSSRGDDVVAERRPRRSTRRFSESRRRLARRAAGPHPPPALLSSPVVCRLLLLCFLSVILSFRLSASTRQNAKRKKKAENTSKKKAQNHALKKTSKISQKLDISFSQQIFITKMIALIDAK